MFEVQPYYWLFLFRSIRGGGGNFEVATSLEFQLHPVSEMLQVSLFIQSIIVIQSAGISANRISMFGEIPIWGLYVLHAEGLQPKNIKIVSKGDDYRAAIIFDDVNSLKLDGLEIPTVSTSPLVIPSKVNNHTLKRLTYPLKKVKPSAFNNH